MASRQLGIDEVGQAITQGNVNLPTGTLYGTHQAFTVQANGQLNKAADYAPLVITYRNGAPVRLGDLARSRIVSKTKNRDLVLRSARWNPPFDLARRFSDNLGPNTVEVVDNIKALLPSFEAVMPPP